MQQIFSSAGSGKILVLVLVVKAYYTNRRQIQYFCQVFVKIVPYLRSVDLKLYQKKQIGIAITVQSK